MRTPDHVKSGDVSFNMTPMIDVVFLLLIFFLVASHLARQETQLELPLPAADSGEETAAADAPRLTINLLADGAMLVAGRPLAAAELRERLAERRRAEGDRLEVRIRADRNSPYRHAAAVMRACAQAGVWNVTYAVYSREDQG